MPLNTPDNTVGGPWGASPYPPWFEQYVHPGASPSEKANQFVNWIRRHPEQTDLGQYWNQFREGGQYYGADQPFTTDSTNQNPPPGDDPNDPTNHGPGGQNNHVQTSRPTTPGGEGPGHWQRLVSFVNGVRKERWVWRADPVTPTPAPAPPATDVPVATTPPADETPYVGKPKPNPGGWQNQKPTPQQGGPAGTQGTQKTANIGVNPSLTANSQNQTMNTNPPPPGNVPLPGNRMVANAFSGQGFANPNRKPLLKNPPQV